MAWLTRIKMLIAATLVFGFIPAVVGGTYIYVESKPQPVVDLRDSVVRVTVTTTEGTSSGTGFFVAPGIVITNQHVIDSAGAVSIALRDGRKADAVVLASDEWNDIAILWTSASSEPVLPLGCVRPKFNDDVFIIGHPLVARWARFSGKVASDEQPDFNGAEAPNVVLLDVGIDRGASGSPLFDEHGVVYGIIRAVVLADIALATPSNTGVATPGNEVCVFLREQGIRYR